MDGWEISLLCHPNLTGLLRMIILTVVRLCIKNKYQFAGYFSIKNAFAKREKVYEL